MLQNDWSYFAAHPRFSYVRKAVAEIERTWVTQLELGQSSGLFRVDLDPRLNKVAFTRNCIRRRLR